MLRHSLTPCVRRVVAVRCIGAWVAVVVGLVTVPAVAAPAPQRTRFELPVSNGHSAVLLDLQQRRLVQWREHLFAAEEPVLDAQGEEVWDGSQFAASYTRDLLYDAYFGIRVAGQQQWLTDAAVDLDASGYRGWKAGETGGTGIVTMVQSLGTLRASTHVFAPRGLEAGAFVLVLEVENTGNAPITGVSAFSLHNFHLGYGRPSQPWDVGQDIAANGETIEYDASGGHARFRERGFAGVVVTRALAPISHRGVGPGADLYNLVNAGAPVDFPDNNPPANAVDDSISGFQWNLGDLAPGAKKTVGIAVLHHPDPFAGAAAQTKLDAYVGAKDAAAVVAAEVAAWADFQTNTVHLPAGLSPEETTLVRHNAAMLTMGQVREDRYYLREWLAADGEPRTTRFLDDDNKPVVLPAEVKHHGAGAILASMPPGNWTYAWIRDGAYATAALSTLGMIDQARSALEYYLKAEAGRFREWDELADYNMPPYQISLVRYYGFGIEETDFNAYGPNLEFDGFGLFLWALRVHEHKTGDTSIADANWPLIRDRIADVLLALVDPDNGLIRPDSSIWETHWNGRQRYFAYTSLTAARGLCDAAAIAERLGDADAAARYKAGGEALRAAIAEHLTDRSGAIASTLEELQTGAGYWDAAVLDAIAMELFDPSGTIAQATLKGLDVHLRVDAGPGWSRNDDRWDHPNSDDLSPWGSDYDSAEWVITDLRGAVALQMAGDQARAATLADWVRTQAEVNYLMVAETFDEVAGTYKFNAPMLGFGAGVYTLALAHRAGEAPDPACGAYFDEQHGSSSDTDDATNSSGGDETTGAATTTMTTTDPTPTTDANETQASPTESVPTTTDPLTTTTGASAGETAGTEPGEDSGCACNGNTSNTPAGGLLGGLWLVLGWRRRRRATR